MYRLLSLLLVVVAVEGCGSPPRAVGVRIQPEEKDVLLCRVDLTGPLSPGGYVDWAERNLDRLGRAPVNPFYPGTPVYRLRYLFFEGVRPLASVTFERDENPAGDGFLVFQSARIRSRGAGP
jgi:hypothetical protein